MDLQELKPTLLVDDVLEHVDLWAMVESATNGFWLWRIDRDELYWSQGVADTLGYDLVNTDDIPPLLELTHPEDRERHRRVVNESMRTGSNYYIEVRMLRRDGEHVWLAASGLWRARPGEPPHTMFGFVRDISDRIDAVQKLEASESRFRSFFDQVPAAVFIKDENSRNLYGNETAAQYLGATLEDFLAKELEELTDPESAAALRAADREALEGDEKVTWVGPVQLPGESRARHVWDTKFPIHAPDGSRLLGGIGIDVTALHETQKQLAVAQRLESIGLMAGGIAHDFNNLLFAIAGNAEIAMQHVSSEHRANIESILAATEHASALCRQLLAMGGRSETESDSVSVGALVDESVELLELTLQAEHPLEVSIHRGDCEVRIDPALLRQALVNLVLNAKQASQPGAPVTIGCENVPLGPIAGASGREVHSWLPEDADRGVCVYVRDRGRGISPELIERIFDPYYTDDELGHGLGLATVLGIVKAARGAIRVESTPGEGSSFEIYLPMAEAGAEVPGDTVRMPVPDEAPAPRLRRVMVIDDHAEIVAIVVAWLERLGVEVTPYTSSLLAVDVLRDRHAEFDAVLTDISMPDIGGIGVLQAVREHDADKPVILASGYNDSAFQVDEDPRVWFLQKPYSLAELQRVLEEAAA